MASETKKVRTRTAHFFFVDIVGLSDDAIPSENQARKIEILNKAIRECTSFSNVIKEMIIPTGDGAVMGFDDIEDPIKLAIELHSKLKVYNEKKAQQEQVRVRIGINSGPVILVEDLKGNLNYWGDGTIIARRVMDAGNADHILLSSWMADQLIRLRQSYRDCIHKTKNATFKHKRRETIYSAYSEDFGNPYPPDKKQSELDAHPYVEESLTIIDPKTMSTLHKCGYEIFDPLDDTMTSVVPISMHIEMFAEDMQLRAYDEDGNDLPFEVYADTPTLKQVVVFFTTPIPKGERKKFFVEFTSNEERRHYYLDYRSNIKKVVFKLAYPSNSDILPVFYREVNDKKIRLRKQPPNRKIQGRREIRWEKKNFLPTETFLIEW